MITQHVATRVPSEAIDRARELYPDTRDMAPSRIVRYLFAIALGEDPKKFSQDLRIGRRIKANPDQTGD